MLVSIIISNYNYGRFLGAAIDTALAQTWPNLEIIVVDDGSTDESRTIIEHYGSAVRSIFKANGGQTSAFNAGFAASSGEVVIFLDADDQLHPHCVETVMRHWTPGVTKVQYRLNTIDASGQDLRMPFPYYSARLCRDTGEAQRQLLRVGSYPWPVSSGNAFSRWYLKQAMPIPPQFNRAPDGLLNRLAPLHGPVMSVPDILGDYRVHGANVLAQQGLAPEKYAANVKYEIEREAFYSERARALGYGISETILLKNKKHLETRLFSLRLCPELHPLPKDRIARLVWLGINGALRAPDLHLVGRSIWLLWFLMLGLLPRRALAFLIRHLRLQSGRAQLARMIVDLAKF